MADDDEGASRIEEDQVIPLILTACPSFQEEWNKCEHRELLYGVMGDLARHLLALYRKGRTEEFGPLCKAIETFHTDGSLSVQNLATIGILEGIQNVWGNNDEDPEHFYEFLLPESRKWWKKLNDFWQVVGAGLKRKDDSLKRQL
jgi:hypothetical protein